MGQDVVFSVTVKDTQSAGAFMRIAQGIAAAGKASSAAGKASQKAGEDAAKGWNLADAAITRMRNTVLQTTIGTTGLYAGFRLIANEIQRVSELQDKAFGKLQASMASHGQMIMNIPEGWMTDAKQRTEFIDKGLRAMRQPTAEPFFKMAAQGFGGHARLNEQQTKDTILNVAQFAGKMHLSPEDSEPLQSVVMDTMNAMIAKGEKPDVKEILGTYKSVMTEARSVTLHDLATFDARAILYHYTKGGAKNLAQAAAYQVAIAGDMPDPKGRRAATGDINIWESFRKAYGDVAEKSPSFRSKDYPTVEAWDLATPNEKIAAINADTKFGLAMQAHLKGNLAADPRARNLAHAMSWGSGSLQGEAGLRQMGEIMISPNSYIVERAKQAEAAIRTGPAAAKLLDQTLHAAPVTEQERAMEQIGIKQGAQAAQDFNNLSQAKRGTYIETVRELGETTQTNWAKQTWRNLAATMRARGATTQTEQDRLSIEAHQRAITDLYGNYPSDPVDVRKFHEWAAENYPNEKRGFSEALFSGQVYNAKAFRSYRQLQMSPEEKRQIAIEEDAIKQLQEQPQSLQSIQESGGGGRGVTTSWEESPATTPATPGPTDQSMNSLIGSVRELVDVLKLRGPVDLRLDDRGGRPLARISSRPRGIEGLSDVG